GPSKAKKQQRCMQLIEQLLEQYEERFFRPVEILEDDRSRCGAQPSLEVSRHPEGELAPPRVGRQLRLGRVGVGEGEGCKLARDRSRLQLVKSLHAGDARLDLRACGITTVGRCDRGFSADQLLKRPVGDRVSVGETGGTCDRLDRVQPSEELDRVTRLSHAGVAIYRHEVLSTCRSYATVVYYVKRHLLYHSTY